MKKRSGREIKRCHHRDTEWKGQEPEFRSQEPRGKEQAMGWPGEIRCAITFGEFHRLKAMGQTVWSEELRAWRKRAGYGLAR
jgi:hypothetical protein